MGFASLEENPNTNGMACCVRVDNILDSLSPALESRGGERDSSRWWKYPPKSIGSRKSYLFGKDIEDTATRTVKANLVSNKLPEASR